MNDEQKQLIREKFLKMGMEVSPTNEAMTFEDIADWWLNELDLAIKQTEERIVREIEENFPEKNYTEMAGLNDYATGTENGVIYCKNKIITLIRNK